MNTIIVASMRKSAGKTSLIVGLAKALNKRAAYLKPLGDRLLYRKKRLWDHDAALMAAVFGLAEGADDMCVGFDHSKLWYMYDEKGIRVKLAELAAKAGKDRDVLFVEAGQDLAYGASVHLDAVSVARHLGGKLVVVAGGEEARLLDDIAFLKRRVDLAGVAFAGVVVNKVRDIDAFESTCRGAIATMGVNLLGMIPHVPELARLSVGYLGECLFAKVLAGEAGLGKVVQNVFAGAGGAEDALRSPLFRKEGTLVIADGDRSDLILAALDSPTTAGIVLARDVVPPANLLAKAGERGIPMLLVHSHVYEAARQIEAVEPLLTKDADRLALAEKLVKERVDLAKLSG